MRTYPRAVRARSIVLLLLVAAGCYRAGVDGPEATAWLEARGRAAKTWEPCLRMASAMRAECGADRECGDAVTRHFSFWCYAGRYRGPSTGDDPMTLSPCFWDRTEGAPSRAAWIDGTCARLDLGAPCRDELRAILAICDEGGHYELTGVGD